MLHTKAQLTFPAWLVTTFSMRLIEENQKEDSVLQIQRITNTVALILLLELTEKKDKNLPLHIRGGGACLLARLNRAYTACTLSACPSAN